jgi:hypothetical protein
MMKRLTLDLVYRILVEHNGLDGNGKCVCGERIPSLHPAFVTEHDWAAHVVKSIATAREKD